MLRFLFWLAAQAALAPLSLAFLAWWGVSMLVAVLAPSTRAGPNPYRGASMTAIAVLAWRATAHALGPRNDPAAARLFAALPGTSSRAWRLLMSVQQLCLYVSGLRGCDAEDHPLMGWFKCAPVLAVLPYRTQLIDAAIAALMPEQVVILGAGFDPRAYTRAALPMDCTVFEIDAPATQTLKRATVSQPGFIPEADAGVLDRVSFVPCDFTRQSWREQLAASTFDASKRTMYLWEGVTYYLPRDVTEATLRELGELLRLSTSAESAVALDLLDGATVARRTFFGWLAQLVLGLLGEPLLMGVDMSTGASIADWARGFGLQVVREDRLYWGEGAAISAVAAR